MADFSGGPGFAAFVATFLMVAAAIVLMLSLSRHLRKVRTHPSDGDDAQPADASATDDGATLADEAATPSAPTLSAPTPEGETKA